MNKLIQNKYIIKLIFLIPLIISILLIYEWDKYSDSTTFVVLSIIFHIISGVYYFIACLQWVFETNIIIMPFFHKMKNVYSTYGTYIISNYRSYGYRIYKNKYIFFLTPINENTISSVSINFIKEKILEVIKAHHYSDENRTEIDMNKWDGVLDKTTQRDKEIDKLV